MKSSPVPAKAIGVLRSTHLGSGDQGAQVGRGHGEVSDALALHGLGGRGLGLGKACRERPSVYGLGSAYPLECSQALP